MTFEADGTRVVQPLDPSQGTRYSEPAEDQMEGPILEQIYQMTAGKREDLLC